MQLIKRLTFSLFALFMLTLFNYWIYFIMTKDQVYYSAEKLHNYHHMLILGAGKNNPIFYSRMDAAIYLYLSSNIDKIVCSGLTGVINYSEPYDMRAYLLKNNIPDSIIEIDTAGKHTFNSVVNYSARYMGDSVIIVSQAQHLNRALLIANSRGLHAVGLAASGFNGHYNHEWFFVEYLSRIKCSFNLIFYC